MTGWTREDSAELDSEIKRLRELERKERQSGLPKRLKDAPLQRRRPRPTPRRLADGSWRARCPRSGQDYSMRFDTQAQAEAWLDRLSGGN